MSLNSMLDEAAAEATEHAHVMAVMDPKEGDLKTVWDPDNEAEVKVARCAFEEMKKKGLVGYRVKRDGSKAEVMHEFDPEAEAVIMAPALRGG